MKALKIIGVILIVLVALFFIVALFLPAKLHMEKSVVINKPASLIFKQVNNYKNWENWSPWAESDPGMIMTYEGPELGVGSSYSWVSPMYGDGKMTILESEPYTRVHNELMFTEEGTSYSDFLFEETPEGTRVTWTLDIPHLTYPVERYFGLLMPGMMNKFYIKGLDNLKNICEAMPDPYTIKMTILPESQVVTVLDSCNWADMEAKMDEMFGELTAFMDKNKDTQVAGAHFTRYHKWDEQNQFAVFEAGFPVSQAVKSKGRVEYEVFPETKAITGTFFGNYEDIGGLYMAMEEYVKEYGLQEDCCPMEVYLVNPATEPDPAKWQTDVYFPIK